MVIELSLTRSSGWAKNNLSGVQKLIKIRQGFGEYMKLLKGKRDFSSMFSRDFHAFSSYTARAESSDSLQPWAMKLL